MAKIKIKRERVKFASDNVAGACPEVLDAILKANEGDSTPYGNDSISTELQLSLIHISEPTRRTPSSYAVFCLKKKKKKN